MNVHLNKFLITFSVVILYFANSYAQNRTQIQEHIIKSEETIYSIAKKYNASTEKIYKLNPWAKDTIHPGKKLLVPINSKEDSTALRTQPVNHVIKKGETLYAISKQYQVSEERIMIANPGISARTFPIGKNIIIPANSTKAPTPQPTNSTNINTDKSDSDKVEKQVVNAALILPLEKNNAVKYMEFYEGFLMGLNDLKKDGISVRLKVIDASTDATVNDAINLGKLNSCDLIIGGVSENQIYAINMARKTANYVIPFNSNKDFTDNNPNLFQINPPQENLYRIIGSEFVRKYKGYTVKFIGRSSDFEDNYIKAIKEAVRKANMPFEELTLSGNLPLQGNRTVLVPTNAEKELAKKLLASINKDDVCTIFAPAQWQSMRGIQMEQMKKYNTTIYSTFFFDANTWESKRFLSQYNVWYNHSIAFSYPKYGVLGYDIAKYFVRAHTVYGKSFMRKSYMLPSDGLQTDFKFQSLKSGSGYLNQNLFFVSFMKDGSIKRIAF
ncbi:PBP1 and LysM peptidoglycan-binding domain-containing protein [Porphyromonas pogonae]|uniref:PBP1 and LysM peptidoglycan-binding domain-containing protein n=1 Tax=Porphyromonas pogonae TaxID=867595 RepID=UPI002E7A651C|nr:LysM peptidoglycan-binding domain-containing protein [Porphyromonas pogonae]